MMNSSPHGLTRGPILAPGQVPSSGLVNITAPCAPSNMMLNKPSSNLLSPMEVIPSNIPPTAFSSPIVLTNLPNGYHGYAITPACKTNVMPSNEQSPMNAILANAPVSMNVVSSNTQLPMNATSSVPTSLNVMSSNLPSTLNVMSSNMQSQVSVMSSNMPLTGNAMSSSLPLTGYTMSSSMPFQKEVTPEVKTVYVYIPRPAPDVCDASTQTMESDFHPKLKEKFNFTNVTVKRENQESVAGADVFSPQSVGKSNIKDLFKYYTGFSFLTYTALFNVLFPNSGDNPVKYSMNCEETEQVPLYNQLFLVLCRLRQGFGLDDLAFRFNIQRQTACVIFDSVVHYMYLRLKDVPLWPQRLTILQSIPQTAHPIMSIFGYTELKTLLSSDEDVQAETCPDCEPKSTLQGLVAVSPNGDVSFVSVLFSGGLSQREICKLSGFLGVLHEQKLNGQLEAGDSIVGTKGLMMKKDFSKIGLCLRQSPTIFEDGSNVKMLNTSEIINQRIEKIREFKVIGGGIPAGLFSTINEVWFVCAMLTNFQTTPLPSRSF